MESHNTAIYQNANSLRMHQDNLRWTILAGYLTFFSASSALLQKDILPKHPSSTIPLFLFCVGNLFLLILAIESWYYNLYSRYVDDCEAKLLKGEGLLAVSAFRESAKETISPFHYSFIFALSINVLGNAFYARHFLGWHACCLGVYVSIWLILLITWKYTVYGCVLWPLHRLFTLLHREDKGKT